MRTISALRRVLPTVLGLQLILSITAKGGERANVRGMSMARTFVAASRGLDAVGINPANLALADHGTVTFGILPFGVHIGSDLLDYELYTTYFTGTGTDSGRVGRYLTENDKERLLSSLEDGLTHSRVDIDSRLFGLSLRLPEVGAFAFTISEEATGFVNLPRDYVEFLLHGNQPGSNYDFQTTTAMASWTRNYSVSFGTALPGVSFVKSLSAGASIKLVHGFGYYEVERFNTSLNTAEDGALTGSIDFLSRHAGALPFDEGYSVFPSPAGTGWGVDVGFSGYVEKYLLVGVSVTDIGSIAWKKHIREDYADTTIVVDDPLQSEQRNGIENLVQGDQRTGSAFKSPLPTQLRLGCALAMHEMMEWKDAELLLALDYNQGLVISPRSTTTPRVSFGLEYKPVKWLPLRSGISFGGTDKMNVALGFGLCFSLFELEVASENVTWLLEPGSFSHGSVAIGTRFRL